MKILLQRLFRRRPKPSPEVYFLSSPEWVGEFPVRKDLEVTTVSEDRPFRGWKIERFESVGSINVWMLVPKDMLWARGLNEWTQWLGWTLRPERKGDSWGWKINWFNPFPLLWSTVFPRREYPNV